MLRVPSIEETVIGAWFAVQLRAYVKMKRLYEIQNRDDYNWRKNDYYVSQTEVHILRQQKNIALRTLACEVGIEAADAFQQTLGSTMSLRSLR